MPNNIALLPLSRPRIPALIGLIDGIPDFSHGLETALGGAPLERGAFVTDHAVARPQKLTVQGYVSNLSDALGAKPTLAWQAIRKLQAEITPVTVITPHHVYSEMLIAKCDTSQAGLGLQFTMELEEVLRVSVANESPIINASFFTRDGLIGGLAGAATSIIGQAGSGLISQVTSLTGLADNISGGAVGRTAAKIRGRVSLATGAARRFVSFF